MLILGLSGTNEIGVHDAAACLLEDNKIIAFAEEERFVGIKHAPGHFPVNAIKFCLTQGNVKFTDIDKVTFYVKPNFLNYLKRTKISRPQSIIGALNIYKMHRNTVKDNLSHHFRINPKTEFVEHHLAHAASTFFLSGFKKANIISVDAVGERTCTLLAYGNDNTIEKIREFYMPNSLGFLYASFTDFLGFRPNSDEGKTMGLAPYGKPIFDFSDIISLEKNGGYKVNPKFVTGYYSEEMIKKFGEPRLSGELTENHKNIAASLQSALEKTVIHLAKWLYEQTGCKNLCLGGGVALNCKMNGILLQQDFIDDMFIQPASSDAGGALGSAVYYAVNNGYKFDKMSHCYWGPAYNNEEIEKTLQLAKVKYEFIGDISGAVAELLAQNKIVGWFQGRMEVGPRALGARSILGNPQNPKMKDLINFYVKHREPWRPFCPSLTKQSEGKYLDGKIADAPFMILSYQVKESVANKIPSVVHVDNSTRPQSIERDTNPLYYDMVKEFGKITGDSVVLNTSFNDKGQPIVRTPEQGMKMFYGTGMDCLALGNFLLKK